MGWEEDLLHPSVLFSAEAVMDRPGPVPAQAGVYAWYFTSVPALVPDDKCHRHDGGVLLYVGISPKAPPANGAPASRQSLRTRIRYHYRGNAAGSTLRLTLGCLLSDDLGIGLRRVGSGTRLTFGHDGEALVTAWMAEHAKVTWTTVDHPWELEHELIRSHDLPLNLDQNRHHPFHAEMSAQRARQRALAKALPIIAG
jgi:hypothetical protein